MPISCLSPLNRRLSIGGSSGCMDEPVNPEPDPPLDPPVDPPTNPTANLALRTYFAGLTVSAPFEVGSGGINFQQNITGTDAITGFHVPNSLAPVIGTCLSYSQLIPDYIATAGNVNGQLNNIIQNTSMCAGVTGAKELYQVQYTRTVPVGGYESKPQNDFHFRRVAVSGAIPPLPSLYVKKHIILPANLGSILNYALGANYYVVYDFKTSNAAGVGDYRLSLQALENSAGQLYWKFSADNAANGKGIIPSVGDYNIGDGYWALRSAMNSVILGEELIVEIYFKYPPLIWTRAAVMEAGATGYPYVRNTVDGRSTCVITRVSTGEKIILDKQGGIQCGPENLPQARLMVNLTYCEGNSGSNPAVWSKCSGLEVWDDAPYALV